MGYVEFFVVLLKLTVVYAQNRMFNYNRNDFIAGPLMWGSMSRQCNANRQSPVNIDSRLVRYGTPFRIKFLYKNPVLHGRFRNDGTYPLFEAEHGYKLVGVTHHEKDLYQLHSFHFHTGRNSNEGSEHMIDGKPSSGEIHLVHFKSKYGSIENANKFTDGRAVVAIFYKTGIVSNRPELDAFIRWSLPHIRSRKDRALLTSIRPISFLPESGDAYTYSGSATTPPCRQNIQWVIYRQPIILSKTAVFMLQRSESRQGLPAHVFGSFRPLQRHNGRIIEANFWPTKYMYKKKLPIILKSPQISPFKLKLFPDPLIY